jgi:hypothetical protein
VSATPGLKLLTRMLLPNCSPPSFGDRTDDDDRSASGHQRHNMSAPFLFRGCCRSLFDEISGN